MFLLRTSTQQKLLCVVCCILITYVLYMYMLYGDQVSAYTSFSSTPDKSVQNENLFRPTAAVQPMEYEHLTYYDYKEKDDYKDANLDWLKTILDDASAQPMEYEYVIAHYKENLDWLKSIAEYAHVYDKGHDAGLKPPFPVNHWEELPNVGREGHTYLYHIVTKYDNLANITIFLQGEIDNHANLRICYPTPLEFLDKARKGVSCILIGEYTNWGRIQYNGKWKTELDLGLMRPAKGTFGEFFHEVFGKAPPASIKHCWAGCFSATRKCLRRFPKEVYENMISYVDDHPNPGEGHYMERLWRYIATC